MIETKKNFTPQPNVKDKLPKISGIEFKMVKKNNKIINRAVYSYNHLFHRIDKCGTGGNTCIKFQSPYEKKAHLPF